MGIQHILATLYAPNDIYLDRWIVREEPVPQIHIDFDLWGHPHVAYNHDTLSTRLWRLRKRLQHMGIFERVVQSRTYFKILHLIYFNSNYSFKYFELVHIVHLAYTGVGCQFIDTILPIEPVLFTWSTKVLTFILVLHDKFPSTKEKIQWIMIYEINLI